MPAADGELTEDQRRALQWALFRFRVWLKLAGYSPTTARSLVSAVRCFRVWLAGRPPTLAAREAYLAETRSRFTQGHASRVGVALRLWFEFLQRHRPERLDVER